MMKAKPFAADKLFTLTLHGRNFVFLPGGTQGMLEDPYFSLEYVVKQIEETLASENKEYLGIKMEVIHELTNHHKVIELTNTLAP